MLVSDASLHLLCCLLLCWYTFLSCLFSAALGWFSYAPEWYESPNKTYAQREAQSVSVFVHFLQNERTSGPVDSVSKLQGREGEPSMVWLNNTFGFHLFLWSHPRFREMSLLSPIYKYFKIINLSLCQFLFSLVAGRSHSSCLGLCWQLHKCKGKA
jgi:hypothetical protein